MKKLKSAIGAVVVLTVGIEAAHACGDKAVDLGGLQKGTYYSLTPAAARTIKIDLLRLVELSRAQSAKDLAFQIKEDGELDLSVFENGAFKILAADIVKASAL